MWGALGQKKYDFRFRDKVNNKAIEISDVEEMEDLGNGDFAVQISHSKVNDIIKDAYDAQTFKMTRRFGAGFYIYSLEEDIVRSGFIQTVNAPPQPYTVTTSSWNAKDSKLNPTPVKIDDLEDRVEFYIKNKDKNGEQATLRGIHSSLKEKGVTIIDIERVCCKLGYVVNEAYPYYASTVE